MAVKKITKAAPKTKTASKSLAKPAKSSNVKPARKSPVASYAIREAILGAYADMSYKVCDAVAASVMEDISGFWPSSLVMSMLIGKFVSGLYVVSGPEASAKSTFLATTIGDTIRNGTVLHLHEDVERAMRSSYMGKIVENTCDIPWEVLKGKKEGEKTITHPRYRWLVESSLETVFAEMHDYLMSLPDKIYDAHQKTWHLVFDVPVKGGPFVSKEHVSLHERLAKVLTLDMKKSTKTRKYYDVGDDPSFQAFYALDSVKAMTLTALEERKKGHHQPGLLAKALSDHLPYVKGLFRSKHAVGFFINQMYTNPMAKFTDPEYETAGNAIRLHSDVRCLMKPMSIKEPFEKTKGKPRVNSENSVLGQGRDEYTFKKVTNIKNKFTVMPFLTGTIRIWSSGPCCIPGIDPVYDTFSFLQSIGLANISSSKVVSLADNKLLENYAGSIYKWDDFKYDILDEEGWTLDDKGNYNAPYKGLRSVCRDIIESGQAYLLAQGAVAGGVNHLDDDDSSSDDD